MSAIRLSAAQSRMLQNIVDGRGSHAHCRTQSDWGGAVATLASLQRLGLVDDDGNPTEAGRTAMEKA